MRQAIDYDNENVLAAKFHKKKHKFVVAWIEFHKEELLANWEVAVKGSDPFPINGSDCGSFRSHYLA